MASPAPTASRSEGQQKPAAPPISLPRGGGAIRGIGEKFAANPVTGTGSLSLPIGTSPGRSGFGPQLSLSYDSGSGNGPFGFGWKLSLPSITRKTDKGLPQYLHDDESDVFILSGAEDLVPEYKRDVAGGWVMKDGKHVVLEDPRTVDGISYSVRCYRPRTEGLFARIERWRNTETGEIYWRSITPANVTTLYGRTAESQIHDPADSSRVFMWLICESYDDRGNAIRFEYEAENSAGIDLSQTHERNRTQQTRSANRYLRHIKYGNVPSRFVQPDLEKMDWLFEVVLDYGEGNVQALPQSPAGHEFVTVTKGAAAVAWPVRTDPFSSYRAGFEVRTYRLCRRVLMFHRFPEELGTPDCLVSSTDFTYHESPIASFLTQVAQSGYVRHSDGTYLKKSMPPLEMEYSQAELNTEVVSVDAANLEQLPAGLDNVRHQLLDLNGEGLPGFLTEQPSGWLYKRNLSPLPDPGGGGELAVARFGAAQLMALQPSLAASSDRHQFLDLSADGQIDVVEFGGGLSGYYERTHDENWKDFVAFSSMPNVDFHDPNLRFIDLTGDGHADILISEAGAFIWYPSLAESGFAPQRRVQQALDEEKGPRLVFADATETIYLADLSGDGLTDLVRIRNGEVCYWPNLGYGRFGPKVTMDGAPWFDAPDLFAPRRIRLGDIDGSGTTDIIYLGRDEITIWRNESGNRWSTPAGLAEFPRTDALSTVMVLDLLGNGTACLVWSSPLPGESRPMRYIDLMGGRKPHLLIAVRNNLGAETHVHYAPSTKFYLADELAGKPWITRLPFPVHVVDRVETFDRVSRNRFVSRSAYHHGCFDAEEREFRGFGMVEQWDTEAFAALSTGGALPNSMNMDEASHVPPVLTRTWFHTGAFLDGVRISRQYEDEYYREPGLSDTEFLAQLLPDTTLPAGVSAEEAREACRSLKGFLLRKEVFALDGTENESHPYSVSERDYTLKRLQPRGENRHAVFFAHPREAIEFHNERTLHETGTGKRADPRVSHALTLDMDNYGNVLVSAAIGYGRRFEDSDSGLTAEDRKKQKKTHVTFSLNAVTNPVIEPDAYRKPVVCESRTFELLNANPNSGLPGTTSLFDFDELAGLIEQAGDGLHELPYEDIDTTGVTGNKAFRRLLEHTRTVYRDNELMGLLPSGKLESAAMPGESYTLALTPGLLSQVFVAPGTATLPELNAMLGDKNVGGYVHSQGDLTWWIPSGRVFYSPDPGDLPSQELALAREHFFLPARLQDPFGNAGTVSYDAYDLLPTKTKDALQNTIVAEHNYRVLQPRLIIDPNGNRSKVDFDALGMVVGTAATDKSETLGDTLDGFVPDLSASEVQSHMETPLADPHALLEGATTRLVYDLFAYLRTKNDPHPQPAVVCTLAREAHVSDLAPGEKVRIQHSFSYSDGFGREIQKKIQAEPDPLQNGGPEVSPRWVGSGWTLFNNKGKPVRQYEPFFSGTHRFEFAHTDGVSPVLFYDPIDRVVATLHPNRTWQKVVFDPWRQESWDVNDTVLMTDPKTDTDVGAFFKRLPDANYLPTWHAQRIGGSLGLAEQEAAKKAAVHHATPAIVHLDSLGRTFLAVADNGPAGKYQTRIELDIEGNQRAVIDALNRVVMRFDHDMLGTAIRSSSLEAGERWMLHDASGQPIAGWDSRGHRLRYSYDALRRPVEVWLRTNSDPERLIQRTVYGETKGEALNHRTRVFQVFDGAGIVTSEHYDFKGNLTESNRRLASEYKKVVDWSNNVALDPAVYTQSTVFDALNRPIKLTTPDHSVIEPLYNEANLLDRIEVKLQGSATTTTFVQDIDYNARGQRTLIEYGNGARTEHEYDTESFRLTRSRTLRGNEALQDLRYAHDAAGNITAINDDAQQAIFFDNAVVTANATYTYDAIYRLVHATGREHIGQAGSPQTTWNDEYRVNLPHPHDGQAMRTYAERYEYDAVGNMLALIHSAAEGNWKRTFTYNEASHLEPGRVSNRLSATAVGNGSEGHYTYDAHGNMTRMPHLPLIQWDYLDRLAVSSRQVVEDGTPERTYYVYDAAGQRVRKITERAAPGGTAPTRKDERIYLAGFEVYREYTVAGATSLQRESLHVLDGESRIALVERRVLGTDGSPPRVIRFQMGNHLGSATVELDDHAQIISYEEYHPYGATSYQAGRRIAEVSLKRYRFTGKERDEETGLSYHGARYYAPWLGRWTNCDPAGLVDGPNRYSYSRTAPATVIDPSGRQGKTVIEESELRLVNRRTGRLETVERSRTTILSGVTVEGDAEAPKVELPEMVVAGDDPEIVTAAAEHGWSVEAERFYRHTPGVIQAQDIRGFGRGLLNSPAATVEGLAGLAGINLDLSALKVEVPHDEQSGAFLGENMGPGPAAVLSPVAKGVGVAGKALQLEMKGAKLTSEAGELVRDTRGSIDLDKIAQRLTPVTDPVQSNAAREASKGLREGATTSEAGGIFHELSGARGAGEGVDFARHGSPSGDPLAQPFLQELASHYGPMEAIQFIGKTTQSLKYSLKHQLQTNGLVPIRDVLHVYIDPSTGKAVKVHQP